MFRGDKRTEGNNDYDSNVGKGDNALYQQVKRIIDNYIMEYRKFIGIDYSPNYELQLKEVSQEKADTDGIESPANTRFIIDIQKHILSIATNLSIEKYIVFHELTHMLDSDLYVKGNKMRKMGLGGYTEYHASQIGFAELLGASEVENINSFSMNDICKTISGDKSILEYVREKQQTAIFLFNKEGFPADLKQLFDALGVLFNYWGLRSICEMYATDFVEIVDNDAFMECIPSNHFCAINRLMHGWLDEKQIEQSMIIYNTIICTIVQQRNLLN